MKRLETVKNIMLQAMRFFPIPMGIAFILALIYNSIILKSNIDVGEGLSELIILLVIGFFLFIWAGLHRYSLEKKGIVIVHIVATLLWLYVGVELFYLNSKMNEVLFFKLMFITLSAILSYTYVPFLKDRANNVKLLVHVNQLQHAFVGAVPFVFLFGLALLIIQGTLKFLFAFKMETLLALIYFNGALTMVLYTFFNILLINPLTFKADMKKYLSTKKRYMTWLLYAFTIIIFTVLNLFVLKIIFTQELPKGQVAWMVMGFSLFAFLSYFSLALNTSKIKKYNTLLWGTLVVQSLVLLSSISIRVYEYGVTEKRYLLVAYGLWLFAISLYFLIQKTKAKIFYIFASLSVLILLSQVGPVNGYLVSKYSQQQRLITLIEHYKKDVEAKKYPTINELEDVYRYLRKTHGQESIEELFPEIEKTEDLTLTKLLNALGIQEDKEEFYKHHKIKIADRHYTRKYHEWYEVKGYDMLFSNQSRMNGRKQLSLDKNRILFVDTSDTNISMTIDDDVMVFDIEKIIKPLMSLKNTEYIDDEKMTLVKENQNYKIKVVFKHIWTRDNKTKSYSYYMDIYVLRKSGEKKDEQ